MADNINIKDSGGTVIPVATDEVTTLNGATVAAVDVQRIKLGYGIDGSYQDVDPTHPAPVTDTALGTSLASLVAASHTDLAAILAKLSADPATQTTLAAVLAKLTADPATQTTLAAVLAKLTSDPSTGANQTTQSGKLDTLHADLGHLTDGTAQVKYAAPASSTPANVAASTSSVTLAAANASRRGLYVYNDGTANLFLKLGATASTSSFSVKIPAGGLYELPAPYYRGTVDGIWDAANGNARVTEIA